MILNGTLRNNALGLAIMLALPAAATAAAPAPQMGSAPATEAPSAGAMGAAEFAPAAKLSVPRVLSLSSPSRGEVAGLTARRAQQVKNGTPFFSRTRRNRIERRFS